MSFLNNDSTRFGIEPDHTNVLSQSQKIENNSSEIRVASDSTGLSTFDRTIKVIDTIGNQWHFLLVVFVIEVFIIKWKTIWAKFAVISKAKIAGQEFEIQQTVESVELVKQEGVIVIENSITEVEHGGGQAVDQTSTEIVSLYAVYLNLIEGRYDEAIQAFATLPRNELLEDTRIEDVTSSGVCQF